MSEILNGIWSPSRDWVHRISSPPDRRTDPVDVHVGERQRSDDDYGHPEQEVGGDDQEHAPRDDHLVPPAR